MAKTIIQTIGPLYGEVVNGTVFGRPNGSIYVPSQNTISMSIPANRVYIRDNTTNVVICTSTGSIAWNPNSEKINTVAQSQDTANNIVIDIATDSDFTDIIAKYPAAAGSFNIFNTYFIETDDYAGITAGTTYYIRARLVSGSGVDVAVTDVQTLTGVEV